MLLTILVENFAPLRISYGKNVGFPNSLVDSVITIVDGSRENASILGIFDSFEIPKIRRSYTIIILNLTILP